MTRYSVNEASFEVILQAIGKKLMQLRMKKGYSSHADFAADHDLPRIQYWRMEKGRTNITLKSLTRVLAIHNLGMEDFFRMVFEDARKNG